MFKKISIKNWEDIKKGSTIRNDVYTYYEYVQFKRATGNFMLEPKIVLT